MEAKPVDLKELAHILATRLEWFGPNNLSEDDLTQITFYLELAFNAGVKSCTKTNT